MVFVGFVLGHGCGAGCDPAGFLVRTKSDVEVVRSMPGMSCGGTAASVLLRHGMVVILNVVDG